MEEDTNNSQLKSLIDSVNIAEDLDEQELKAISQQVIQGYESDLHSRSSWEKNLDEWMKLAQQVYEEKTYPWPKAANVKYPLVSTAAMQFSARAYPSLVPSDGKLVKAKVIGKDPNGIKLERAERVSTYMSWQCLYDMPDWETEMDRLLLTLPIAGIMFKKTYWNSIDEKNCSHTILPKNLVVNYWARSLETAERITEVIEMSSRVLKEKQLSGIYRDIDLGEPTNPPPQTSTNTEPVPAGDETTPYIILEQHGYYDLDGDGYAEPYIFTVEKSTGEVLGVRARFDLDSIIIRNEKLVRIDPIHYYTKFSFLPNPDGGFYDIGFGSLLGPLNEAVNTLINQLIDAGTLSTLQAGFLGKGIRVRMGETRFKPGEWKTINATGDDLRKSVFPLPTKEPSGILFQLMGSLITSGKELASVAEIFVGKMPGQNTPATTTMATIEQGMKVFTAVYKRIYKSLSEEFRKLYRLNKIYANPEEYIDVLDIKIGQDDFNAKDHDIFPGADPTAISSTEKLMKAQGLMEMLPTGVLDPVKVVYRVLEAQEQPNWQDLINPQVLQSGQLPPPPPDPKLQEMQMKGQLEQQKIQMQGEAQQRKMELEARGQAVQLAMKAEEHQLDMQHKASLNTIQRAEALHKQRIFSAEAQQKMNLSAAEGAQKLVQKDAEHRQKLTQQKAKPPQGAKSK